MLAFRIVSIAAVLFAIVVGFGQGCSRFQLTAGESQVQHSSVEPSPPCQKPTGLNGTPRNIDETLALINALPRPVTINCFLEALDRPLRLNLSNSTVSAQPAVGNRSPRIFILNNPLVMSIVPEGPDREKLELSYLISSAESIKAEVAFPVTSAVPANEPYDRVRYMAGTSCASCHLNERTALSVTVTTAFISKAYQPKTASKVSLTSLQQELSICNFALEPARCSMLRAILGHGQVQSQDFPTDMAFFF